jgi:homopolymeric O-antigen transport system ATP-binding protein
VRPIIVVEQLGKQYRLGRRLPKATFRDALAESVRKPLRWIGGTSTSEPETIWALHDVSFAVAPGEVLGIVGANGAGKSTLLKIISRITPPTTGRVDLYGRVASLLEVGTGFHPELTGRENVYLNGAVLGMKRAEIAARFDEIVAFAEVERFVDTPVKHYSSGMYMRLAFAVAAHLRPEILLVDEVLAVGDASFQRKCLGKMGDVASAGRTVLFVSHNMTAVSQLCRRALLLAAGRVVRDGSAGDVVASYLAMVSDSTAEQRWDDGRQAPGNDRVRLRAVRAVQAGRLARDVSIDREVTIEVEFWNLRPGGDRLCVNVYLLDALGATVLTTANIPSADLSPDGWFGEAHPVGLFRASCVLPANFLNEGRYHISIYIVTLDVLTIEAQAVHAISFAVFDTGVMRADGNYGRWDGVVRVRLPWRTEFIEPLDDGVNVSRLTAADDPR